MQRVTAGLAQAAAVWPKRSEELAAARQSGQASGVRRERGLGPRRSQAAAGEQPRERRAGRGRRELGRDLAGRNGCGRAARAVRGRSGRAEPRFPTREGRGGAVHRSHRQRPGIAAALGNGSRGRAADPPLPRTGGRGRRGTSHQPLGPRRDAGLARVLDLSEENGGWWYLDGRPLAPREDSSSRRSVPSALLQAPPRSATRARRRRAVPPRRRGHGRNGDALRQLRGAGLGSAGFQRRAGLGLPLGPDGFAVRRRPVPSLRRAARPWGPPWRWAGGC